jgi:hypothetical protein
VPYPAEYRAIRDNSAVLRAVAERTGGRVLRLQDAATWELFDRSDLGASRAARALWQLAAILAAVLIVLDVAWRRIAFDGRDARELAARVTGATPAGTSGAVDALRRARTGAAASGTAVGKAPRAAGGGPATGADGGTRFEAPGTTRTDARQLAEGGAGSAPRPGPAADAPASDPSDTGDSLARLRAARRRAQERREPSADDGSST